MGRIGARAYIRTVAARRACLDIDMPASSYKLNLVRSRYTATVTLTFPVLTLVATWVMATNVNTGNVNVTVAV